MNEVSSETNEWTDEVMSVVPAPVAINDNVQAVMLKSMVPDLG